MEVELIERQALRTADGIDLGVRFDWYRSLPLSCFTFSVHLDGEDVPERDMRLHVNDRDYPLPELSAHFEEFWFVLDVAHLRIRRQVPAGEHEARLELHMRVPYLFDEETGEVLTLPLTYEQRIHVPAAAHEPAGLGR